MQDFDKAFYINLRRRPDRDAEFNSQSVVQELIDHWRLERFEGVDEEPPKKFTLARGVWGCYQSHLRILERFASTPEWRNIFILEDDALFVDNFYNRFKSLRSPSNWGMIYLGGQPLDDCVFSENVNFFRCTNINRTHAYGVSRLYLNEILNGLRDPANLYSNHVDTILGKLHATIPTYIASLRLVSQREGLSDVNGQPQTTREWSYQKIVRQSKKEIQS